MLQEISNKYKWEPEGSWISSIARSLPLELFKVKENWEFWRKCKGRKKIYKIQGREETENTWTKDKVGKDEQLD